MPFRAYALCVYLLSTTGSILCGSYRPTCGPDREQERLRATADDDDDDANGLGLGRNDDDDNDGDPGWAARFRTTAAARAQDRVHRARGAKRHQGPPVPLPDALRQLKSRTAQSDPAWDLCPTHGLTSGAWPCRYRC